MREIAREVNLSESRIRAILGLDGAPTYVKEGQFYGGGRTPNLYDLDEFKTFYKEAVRNKSKPKTEPPKTFNQMATSFLRGKL